MSLRALGYGVGVGLRAFWDYGWFVDPYDGVAVLQVGFLELFVEWPGRSRRDAS